MNERVSITQGLSPRRRAYDIVMRTLLYASAAIICALLIFLIGYILYRGIPSLSWEFLTSEESVINDVQGILPALINTLYIIIATLIFILPLGVGSAIYLTEYATNKKLVSAIEFATETLSGMPSIIFALVGVIVFCELFGLGVSLIAGALSLVMMTLPTVIRTTQESLKTVPQSYREGSLALGSGKWHMIRTVVLPSSVDGIVTGCILAVGRIVGESAALIYTAGTVAEIPSGKDFLFDSTRTLSVHMYALSNEGLYINETYATAVVLLVIVIGINCLSAALAKRIGRRSAK